MKLEEFNKKYRYRSDIIGFERVEYWTVLKESEEGLYYGDCEDYALTLKKNIDGFDNLDLYFCRMSGVGHCVLSDGEYVIDCNVRELVTLKDYNSMFNITEFGKLNKFTIAVKMFKAWIFRTLNLVKD